MIARFSAWRDPRAIGRLLAAACIAVLTARFWLVSSPADFTIWKWAMRLALLIFVHWCLARRDWRLLLYTTLALFVVFLLSLLA
jgi:hypothetical protein